MIGAVVARLMGLTRRGRSIRAVADCSDRAESLRKAGQLEEALRAGREGLSLFRTQRMLRDGAAESTLFLGLTVFVEEVGAEVGCFGADKADLAYAVEKLRFWKEVVVRFPDLACKEPETVRAQREAWHAYLSSRLAARGAVPG